MSVTFYKLKMMVHDRLFFAAMVIIPAFIAAVSGYAVRYEKLNVIPVAIADEDLSVDSETLVGRMKQKDGLKVVAADRQGAIDMLEGNEVEAVFVIKEGFGAAVAAGGAGGLIEIMQAPSSYSAGFVREVMAGEAARLITGSMAAGWVERKYESLGLAAGPKLREKVISYVDAQWEPRPLMTIDYSEAAGAGGRDRTGLPSSVSSSAGLLIVFIMFYILFSSGWLIEERVNGTLKRLAASHRALGFSFAGSILALLLAAALQTAFFYLVIRALFGIELFTGVYSLAVLFAYIMAVIAICMLLSSVLDTPAQLQAGAPLLVLFTGFAGGCFWNIPGMPERLAQLTLFTPQGWALSAINALLADPGDAAAVMKPVVVLLAGALILLPISYIIIIKRMGYDNL